MYCAKKPSTFGSGGYSQTDHLKELLLADEQRDAKARYNLGGIYANGKGVPQDYGQAHMRYNLASVDSAEETREKAVEYLDVLAKRMTREQIPEAQQLSREWKPK